MSIASSRIRGALSCILVLLISPCLVRSSGGSHYECQGESCAHDGTRHIGSDDCRDSDPSNCPEYARHGDCFLNPEWMLINCNRTCGICAKERSKGAIELPDDQDCSDKHRKCSKWAMEMECFVNPAFMSQTCPASCWLCVNATDLHQNGVSETEVNRRRRFSRTDFGLWQTIPKGEKDSVVRDRIRRMNAYARELDNSGPGTACNNQYEDCALWATENDACRTNLTFMLQSCSLACEYCDVIETYRNCRVATRHRDLLPFRDIKSVDNHLMTKGRALDLVNVKGSRSQDHVSNSTEGVCKLNSDVVQDEWVLSVDTNVLCKDDGSNFHIVEDLVKLLKSKDREWVDVPPDEDGHSGQLLNVKRDSDPIIENFVAALSDIINVPKSHIELKFVRYQRRQRFESHMDPRLHDVWKFSGARILSVYVVLEAPIKGGSFGFPELDWLLVDDPQILVWPNVKSMETDKILDRMRSEQFPIVEGQLYAAKVWVHEYPYDEKNPCS